KVGVAAVPLSLSRHGRLEDCALPSAETFIICKKEKFVTAVKYLRDHNRSTGRKSELVLAQLTFVGLKQPGRRILLAFKEICGIELVVAEELPQRAMQIVGAGLDRSVEHSGPRAAVFGAEIRGQDFEFLNGVNRRQNYEIGAVQEVNVI